MSEHVLFVWLCDCMLCLVTAGNSHNMTTARPVAEGGRHMWVWLSIPVSPSLNKPSSSVSHGQMLCKAGSVANNSSVSHSFSGRSKLVVLPLLKAFQNCLTDMQVNM